MAVFKEILGADWTDETGADWTDETDAVWHRVLAKFPHALA